MSKHDHVPPPPPCEHASLKFCAQCDAVECRACGKEWQAGSPWASIERPRTLRNEPSLPVPMPGISDGISGGRRYEGVADPSVRVRLQHRHAYSYEEHPKPA